ncbi:MAG: AAA family ATPase [Magnetococcales bacterium]|nr:AAA family ATPase [Magnetococcales bacterium]
MNQDTRYTSETPFAMDSGLAAFHPGGQRRAILDALEWLVMEGGGLITVTGEKGSGRTTLARLLGQELKERVHFIHVTDPNLSPEGLYRAIRASLHPGTREESGNHSQRRLVQESLALLASQNRKGVLIIEEGQSIAPETFDAIHFLDTLETDGKKVVRIILMGQETLERILERPSLQPIRDRVVRHIRIPPLSLEETREHLKHCVDHAHGGSPFPAFSEEAMVRIHQAAEGNPGRVNLLAHQAIHLALLEASTVIEEKHVRDEPLSRKVSFSTSWRPKFHSWGRKTSHPTVAMARTIRIPVPRPMTAALGSLGMLCLAGILPFLMNQPATVNARNIDPAVDVSTRGEILPPESTLEAVPHSGITANEAPVIAKGPSIPSKKERQTNRTAKVSPVPATTLQPDGPISVPILSLASRTRKIPPMEVEMRKTASGRTGNEIP